MMKEIIKWCLLAVLLAAVLGMIPGAHYPLFGGVSVAAVLQGFVALEIVGLLGLAARDLFQDPATRNAVVVKATSAARRCSGLKSVQLAQWAWTELFPSKGKVTTP